MCLTVYVASDVPLPLIPCDKDRPGISVEDARGSFDSEHSLRAHSGRPFFYMIRPHDGRCACSLAYYHEEWDDEVGEWVKDMTPAELAPRRALADYLAEALRRQASVEVFTFCSGDEDCPPKHRREARPADFATDHTLLNMWQKVEVSGPDPVPGTAPDADRK